MRARGNQRLARIVRGRLEFVLRRALEIEQAVGEHAGAGERRAHFVRDRAEILPDDEAAITLAFERDDPEQLVERIVHIAALERAGAGGDPEQPHQPHDVVDADGARVPHRCAQRLREQCVAAGTQPVRAQRRKPPVLPVQVEVVGRRADIGAEREAGALRPCVGAGAIHRHGEIEVQADRHAVRPAIRRRLSKLDLGLPLQVFEVLDALEILGAEARHFARGRIAERLRPREPAPGGGVGAVEMLLQGFAQRVPAQRLALLGLERTEGARARAAAAHMAFAKVRVQRPEHLEFRPRDAGIIDERRSAQARQPRLPGGGLHLALRGLAFGKIVERLDVEVEHVEPQPRRRAVGARMPRVVRK